MGIPGIYKEIGPGTRISLAKLAIEHLETHNRHLRIAIDISIWQFQVQLGQGGQNPALRTLYYRLLKLLGLGIQPLFIFDGPYKPRLKRNKTGGSFTNHLENFLVKKLLGLFGFPYHDAPGEAEAECALLQQEGLVDAVLSEDVDTMMFGCTKSLRSWTAEGDRNSKTPTHVSMYTAEATTKHSGLDRDGMILVALMSGGDYDTEGLAHCGPKIACEAARAGFGRELCELARDDTAGWITWRERLQHELCTNESKFFKQKHKTIDIPGTFPKQEVLSYYKRPAVSSSERITLLKTSIRWQSDIDILKMRTFVAEAFNWTYRAGAKHFVKGFAPVLLTHKLINLGVQDNVSFNDLEAKAREESRNVTAIHGRRHHWNTDGCPELRVSFIPRNIVGLDMDTEEEPPQPDDIADDSEMDRAESDREETSRSASPTKRKARSTYDPNQSEKIWVLETIIKLGVPLLAETWEEDMRSPKKSASRKARGTAAQAKVTKDTSQDAMEKYVRTIKPFRVKKICSAVSDELSRQDATQMLPVPQDAVTQTSVAPEKPPKTARGRGKKKHDPALVPGKIKEVNPWTLAKRPPDTYMYKSPARYSALGIYAPDDLEHRESRPGRLDDCTQHAKIFIDLVNVPETPSKNFKEKHSGAKPSGSNLSDEQGGRLPDNVTIRTPRQGRNAISRTRQRPSPTRGEVVTGLMTPLAAQEREDSSTPRTLTWKTTREIVDLSYMDEDEGSQRSLNESKIAPQISCSLSPRSEPDMSNVSDDSPLPSPTLLFPPILSPAVGKKSPHKASSTSIPLNASLLYKDGASKKPVIIRESLEGAWKHSEISEMTAGKKSFVGVEVVDMTGLDEM